MENVYNALEEVIQCILQSSSYQTCITLKKQMSENEEITGLIEKIKKVQKKYIRSEYDPSIKKELDDLEEKLLNIPVYHMYHDSLEEVNQMIQMVKDTLNDYFQQLLN